LAKKKRRYCKVCNTPIWNKNSKNYSQSQYCPTHRAEINEEKAERRRIKEAKRIRDKISGFEIIFGERLKTIKAPRCVTKNGTRDLGATTRDSRNKNGSINFEKEMEVIKKELNKIKKGKSYGYSGFDQPKMSVVEETIIDDEEWFTPEDHSEGKMSKKDIYREWIDGYIE